MVLMKASRAENVEVGNMNIELENFEERRAAMYIEQRGLDEAIFTLGKLATRNQKARSILNILLEWKDLSEQEIKNEEEPEPETAMRTHPAPAQTYSVQNRSLSPKETLDLKISKLGISYNEVGIDKEWNPVMKMAFADTRQVNGKNLVIVGNARKHIKELIQNRIPIDMHITKVSENAVFAVPNMDQFFAEKEKRRTIKTDTFKAVLREHGMDVYSAETKKPVRIIKDAWDEIEKAGVWELEVLDESDKQVIAKPVKYLEDESVIQVEVAGGVPLQKKDSEKELYVPKPLKKIIAEDGIWNMQITKENDTTIFLKPVSFVRDYKKTIIGKPEKINGKWNVKTADTNLELVVPGRFTRKFEHVPGTWKFEVMDIRPRRAIVKPVSCIKTASPEEKTREPRQKAKPVRRRRNNNMHDVDRRLKQLKSNGRITF
jgi:hypothetical protein